MKIFGEEHNNEFLLLNNVICLLFLKGDTILFIFIYNFFCLLVLLLLSFFLGKIDFIFIKFN